MHKWIRNIVQITFAIFLLYLGWQFNRFVNFFESGGYGIEAARPAGVEGFLPIGALVGLKHWLVNDQFDPIHPAGLTILLAILTVSFLWRKSFCSWLCPIGTISEGLGKLGKGIIGRNIKLPNLLDNCFMSIKYLLLMFFCWSIFFGMSAPVVQSFIYSPYNMISDVKMLKFFLNLSTTALVVLGVLTLSSVVIRNFWCRYLCPYGALLGLVSLASPLKVTRQEELCIQCNKCTEACPNRINVAKATRVGSVECTNCLNCVQTCPQPLVLQPRLPLGIGQIPIWLVALLVIGTFFAVILLAKFTGHWQTVLTVEHYRVLIPEWQNIGH
jgi:polyferredoxin